MATKPSELEPEVAGTQLEILLWGTETSVQAGEAEAFREMAVAQFGHLRAYLRAVKQLARNHGHEIQELWWTELGGTCRAESTPR